ncbi:hypothetical protein BVRB_6g156210 [Beta vulgaris subsp. vulgaris]|uniref:Uncharacterized protein n=1 Tax=Beta vulgaris subsp. vulgaris TaxID=3555 RepID=A0A0J8B7S7_BETVV|nr:hypothetical protein BVRB_6g156210 [Beta vulgaris subsp. vulgaris]
MVAFELGLNQYFIRCFDTEALWVYKLSSGFEITNAFQEKDWSRDEGPIGPTQDYNSLKIGDLEIKGSNLRKLMKLLCFSRLTVNREGVCFLETMSFDNGADEFQQQYQMIRNLFDWSNFQLIKLPTESNDKDGCYVSAGEKEELTILRKKVADLDKELDQRVFERSGQRAKDFFYQIIFSTRVPFPSQKFAVGSAEAQTEFSSATIKRGEIIPIDEVLTPMDTKPNTSSFPEVAVQVSNGDFDTDNWWVITIATRKINGWATDVKRIIYYDPEIKSRRQVIGDRTIPVPFVVGAEFRFRSSFGLHMIHGVGVRFSFFL